MSTKGRREYNEAKHCGHPMDRTPEHAREKLADYQAQVEELRERAKTRELTRFERVTLNRKLKMFHVYQAQVKQLEESGPDNRPCTQLKGLRTDHSGAGYCFMHCSCKGKKDGHLGYYSQRAKDTELQQLMDELETANHDLLDLTPELFLARAKLKAFINNNQGYDADTMKSFTLVLEGIRKIIETVNNKKFQASLSLETFNVILMRMAEVVMKYITDPEILDRIQADWARISVETGSRRLGSRQLVGQVVAGEES